MTVDFEYIKSRPLSKSSMKEFRKSPKHYIQYLEKPRIPSDEMILGSMVDCMLLTPDRFKSDFMVYRTINKRTNAGKEEWAKLVEAARVEKKTLVDTGMHETAKIVVDAIYNYKDAEFLLDNIRPSSVQRRVRWKNRETGLPCVGYVDFDSDVEEQIFLVELKTTKDADPDVFLRQAVNLQYYIDVGAYLDAYRVSRYEFPYFIFLVAETRPPFNVSVNFVDSKFADFGREEWIGTLLAFKKCMDNGLWDSGYEFRLMDTGNYFGMKLPGYIKKLYGAYDI